MLREGAKRLGRATPNPTHDADQTFGDTFSRLSLVNGYGTECGDDTIKNPRGIHVLIVEKQREGVP